MTEMLIVGGAIAVLMAMTFMLLYRSALAENAIRSKVIEGQKKAREFRREQDEYRKSVAEEAARLDAAGILVPSVKARLIAQGIFG